MNISVFGLGYVGCVSLGCLAQNGHRVIGVDSNEDKVSQVNSGKATIIEQDIDDIIKAQRQQGTVCATTDYTSAVLQTEISVIAVGTPSTANGHLDLSFMNKVTEQIGRVMRDKESFHTILIRSTVPPGTNQSITAIIEAVSGKKRDTGFAVVSNPEFLREGTAVFDYYHPPFTIIGTPLPDVAQVVKELYEKVQGELIVTEPKVAEMIKYVSNSFHALKVTFANEIGAICKALGVDSHRVMEIFVKDTHLNVSPYYLRPGFAYGGSCLPKDLAGLKTLAHDNYIEAPLLENISKSNDLHIKRAVDLIISKDKKRIGFIGLSFKGGTDDLRNSPAVSVIETLLGKGFEILVYDRDISLTKLTGTNWNYIQKHLPHLSKLLATTAKEVINRSEVIVFANSSVALNGEDHSLQGKILVDLEGVGKQFRENNEYVGVSW